MTGVTKGHDSSHGWYWCCYWEDVAQKHHTKRFTIKKYEGDAMRCALYYRHFIERTVSHYKESAEDIPVGYTPEKHRLSPMYFEEASDIQLSQSISYKEKKK